MNRMIMTICTVALFFLSVAAVAGTIYTWTDADGVKRYSNSQPPEGTEDVQTIQEIQYDQDGEDTRRQAFDEMVQEASENADRHFVQQAEKKAQEAEVRRQAEQEERTRRIIEEQARLRQEIADIDSRALGPTYTMGMKKNQIRMIKERIQALEGELPRSP